MHYFLFDYALMLTVLPRRESEPPIKPHGTAGKAGLQYWASEPLTLMAARSSRTPTDRRQDFL